MKDQTKQLIRFDAFMERALHHPQTGYYAQNINTIGAKGDFSTTATLSPTLGKAIAHSALEWSKLNHSPLQLIEIGGGDGSLASSVISSIPFLKRLRLIYHIVDSSNTLTETQKKQNTSKKITWHKTIHTALKQCKGIAFIFSNELVDAFPVRIFKRTKNSWLELYLNGTEEHFQPCNEKLPHSSALSYKSHAEGQRIEVHQAYQEWLTDWLPLWKKGQLLTIDYGDTHPALYYRMPQGTIRAYRSHQRITGNAIYHNPGKQDITADVNFTDLIQWGEKVDLKTFSLISQNDYLTPHITDSAEDQFLIHPAGAGTAFKILLQEKIGSP